MGEELGAHDGNLRDAHGCEPVSPAEKFQLDLRQSSSSCSSSSSSSPLHQRISQPHLQVVLHLRSFPPRPSASPNQLAFNDTSYLNFVSGHNGEYFLD